MTLKSFKNLVAKLRGTRSYILQLQAFHRKAGLLVNTQSKDTVYVRPWILVRWETEWGSADWYEGVWGWVGNTGKC